MLPDEILCIILNELPSHMKPVSRFVCSRWYGCLGKTKFVISEVIAHGDLDVLVWAERELGIKFDDSCCVLAVKHRRLDILVWLYAMGCDLDERVCIAAAERGFLKILKWAHRARAPWGGRTANAAAANGHLRILKWAIGKGCGYTSSILVLLAMVNGHINILNWLIDARVVDINYVYSQVAKAGNLAAIRWIQEKYHDYNNS